MVNWNSQKANGIRKHRPNTDFNADGSGPGPSNPPVPSDMEVRNNGNNIENNRTNGIRPHLNTDFNADGSAPGPSNKTTPSGGIMEVRNANINGNCIENNGIRPHCQNTDSNADGSAPGPSNANDRFSDIGNGSGNIQMNGNGVQNNVGIQGNPGRIAHESFPGPSNQPHPSGSARDAYRIAQVDRTLPAPRLSIGSIPRAKPMSKAEREQWKKQVMEKAARERTGAGNQASQSSQTTPMSSNNAPMYVPSGSSRMQSNIVLSTQHQSSSNGTRKALQAPLPAVSAQYLPSSMHPNPSATNQYVTQNEPTLNTPNSNGALNTSSSSQGFRHPVATISTATPSTLNGARHTFPEQSRNVTTAPNSSAWNQRPVSSSSATGSLANYQLPLHPTTPGITTREAMNSMPPRKKNVVRYTVASRQYLAAAAASSVSNGQRVLPGPSALGTRPDPHILTNRSQIGTLYESAGAGPSTSSSTQPAFNLPQSAAVLTNSRRNDMIYATESPYLESLLTPKDEDSPSTSQAPTTSTSSSSAPYQLVVPNILFRRPMTTRARRRSTSSPEAYREPIEERKPEDRLTRAQMPPEFVRRLEIDERNKKVEQERTLRSGTPATEPEPNFGVRTGFPHGTKECDEVQAEVRANKAADRRNKRKMPDPVNSPPAKRPARRIPKCHIPREERERANRRRNLPEAQNAVEQRGQEDMVVEAASARRNSSRRLFSGAVGEASNEAPEVQYPEEVDYEDHHVDAVPSRNSDRNRRQEARQDHQRIASTPEHFVEPMNVAGPSQPPPQPSNQDDFDYHDEEIAMGMQVAEPEDQREPERPDEEPEAQGATGGEQMRRPTAEHLEMLRKLSDEEMCHTVESLLREKQYLFRKDINELKKLKLQLTEEELVEDICNNIYGPGPSVFTEAAQKYLWARLLVYQHYEPENRSGDVPKPPTTTAEPSSSAQRQDASSRRASAASRRSASNQSTGQGSQQPTTSTPTSAQSQFSAAPTRSSSRSHSRRSGSTRQEVEKMAAQTPPVMRNSRSNRIRRSTVEAPEAQNPLEPDYEIQNGVEAAPASNSEENRHQEVRHDHPRFASSPEDVVEPMNVAGPSQPLPQPSFQDDFNFPVEEIPMEAAKPEDYGIPERAPEAAQQPESPIREAVEHDGIEERQEEDQSSSQLSNEAGNEVEEQEDPQQPANDMNNIEMEVAENLEHVGDLELQNAEIPQPGAVENVAAERENGAEDAGEAEDDGGVDPGMMLSMQIVQLSRKNVIRICGIVLEETFPNDYEMVENNEHFSGAQLLLAVFQPRPPREFLFSQAGKEKLRQFLITNKNFLG